MLQMIMGIWDAFNYFANFKSLKKNPLDGFPNNEFSECRGGEATDFNKVNMSPQLSFWSLPAILQFHLNRRQENLPDVLVKSKTHRL